jgi:hypothetical protein
MNGLRKPNRPMPTGTKNEEGPPQGQPSSEHCSRRLATKPRASLLRLLGAVHLALVADWSPDIRSAGERCEE